VGSLQFLAGSHQLPVQTVMASITSSSPHNSVPPDQLARAGSQASMLAIGPTGQMLPGIAMDPTGSISNRYGSGQCTKYVAGRRQVPANWGNANTWYPRAAAAGWSVGTVPAVGAIAWTSAGPLGHVALVEQISPDYESIQISEMNEQGLGVIDSRWVSASSFKFIYAPGY
jgi:surface antigen